MDHTLYLLDIDGVLADDRHRVDFARNKQWSRYFDPRVVATDGLWREGWNLAWALYLQPPGTSLTYLTGRSEDLRATTRAWLSKMALPEGDLIMRPRYAPKTNRPRLADFKVDIIRDLIVSRPVVLYDDDPEVVRAVRAAFGDQAAVRCTWHVKEKFLVKEAVS